MPPPTPLAIKTSSVIRLTKEEASYHKELDAQTARLERMQQAEADEYEIKQQVGVVKETKEVLPSVRKKLEAAIEALEFELEGAENETDEAKEKARTAIENAKKALEVELKE